MREKEAAELLSRIPHVTIATATSDGRPWNSPVFFGYDDALNLFWTSAIEAQHSKNIRGNGRAFLVVYEAGVYPTRAVYIDALAVELSDAGEVRRCFEYYEARLNDPSFSSDMFLGDSVSRMYRAVPRRVWLHDKEVFSEEGHYIDVRVELNLDQIRTVL